MNGCPVTNLGDRQLHASMQPRRPPRCGWGAPCTRARHAHACTLPAGLVVVKIGKQLHLRPCPRCRQLSRPLMPVAWHMARRAARHAALPQSHRYSRRAWRGGGLAAFVCGSARSPRCHAYGAFDMTVPPVFRTDLRTGLCAWAATRACNPVWQSTVQVQGVACAKRHTRCRASSRMASGACGVSTRKHVRARPCSCGTLRNHMAVELTRADLAESQQLIAANPSDQEPVVADSSTAEPGALRIR